VRRGLHDLRPAFAAAGLALLIAACGDRDAPESNGARVADEAAEPAWHPEVRRPPWVFVFERVGPRCTIFRIDAGERKTQIEAGVACPIDMEVGERLRLAGKTCMREGGGPARETPVRCPDPLTEAEIDFLAAKQKNGELPR